MRIGARSKDHALIHFTSGYPRHEANTASPRGFHIHFEPLISQIFTQLYTHKRTMFPRSWAGNIHRWIANVPVCIKKLDTRTRKNPTTERSEHCESLSILGRGTSSLPMNPLKSCAAHLNNRAQRAIFHSARVLSTII
jgi:hypothetical protein